MTEPRADKKRWYPYSARDQWPCVENGIHCPDRHLGCQDTCGKMLAAKIVNGQRKAIEREKRAVDSGVSEVKHNGYLALKRQKPKER